LVRESIVDTLTGEFEVETAGRAVEAIQRVMRGRYGALVLDLQLPGLGGLDAVPIIKRFDPSVPVIVVTGFGSLETERAVRASGVFYYLPKPFALDELTHAVRAAVRSRGRRARD
jgi:DNA-binding response OmpR family regulator